jgi:hypothetical protein
MDRELTRRSKYGMIKALPPFPPYVSYIMRASVFCQACHLFHTSLLIYRTNIAMRRVEIMKFLAT